MKDPMAGVSHQDWQGLWWLTAAPRMARILLSLQEITPGGGQASQMDEQGARR